MKKTILMAFAVMMVCMFQIVILPAMAQYTCGLQGGKYAKYNWSITGSTMGQSYGESGTVEIYIQSVSGTSYSGNSTFTVTGGTLPSGILSIPQTTQTFIGNVASGYGSTGLIGLLAIPANMTMGSNILGASDVKQIRSWHGRSAVVVNSSGIILGQGDTYFDQTTGIFLYSKTTWNYQGVYSFDYTLEMVGTDLWSGGFGGGFLGLEPWMLAVIIVIIVAAAAFVAIMMHRRKLHAAPEPTPPQPTQPIPPSPA